MNVVFLSESNNLPYFIKMGIRPNEFYTDFDRFKKVSTTYRADTMIVAVFTGNCLFHKSNVVNLLNTLSKRVGITDIVVLSDIQLPALSFPYFMYQGVFDNFVKMQGWNAIDNKFYDVMGYIKDSCSKDTKSCNCVLCKEHKGNIEDARDSYENRKVSDDSYYNMIVVPEI